MKVVWTQTVAKKWEDVFGIFSKGTVEGMCGWIRYEVIKDEVKRGI